MKTGYIKLHRSIMDHFFYNEKRVFSKYEAWQDILLNVNFQNGKAIIKGKLYEVKSGESLLSMDSWASRWMWNKSAVRRFFKLLQESEMIIINSDNITTHLTVCNWERYQVKRNANETQTKRKRNANEFQTTPIEEGKEGKEGKECKEESSTSAIPSFEEFREYGVNKLTELGRDVSKYEYSLKAKYEAWVDSGWIDGNGEEIKRWKGKLSNTVPYLVALDSPESTKLPTDIKPKLNF